MPLQVTDAGLTIDTFTDALNTRIALIRQAFGNQTNLALESILGNLVRIWAELDVSLQEEVLKLYQFTDARTAAATFLDQLASRTGTKRKTATASFVPAVFSGTAGKVIPDGKRVRLDGNSTEWAVSGGPYTIGGGGTVTGELTAVNTGPLVAVATDQWTILDLVDGWASVETLVDASVGRAIESDEELRIRREKELADASNGPLAAVVAQISKVNAVITVEGTENTRTDPVDANGVPKGGINLIVEGGDDQEIIDAIFAAKGGGTEAYGTDVVGYATDSKGNRHRVAFDRIVDLNVYVRITLTTTADPTESPFPGAEALSDIQAAAATYGTTNLRVIGLDVVPYKFVGVVEDLDLPGIDNVLIELSDDGIGWQTTPLDVGSRERPAFDTSRITVLEA